MKYASLLLFICLIFACKPSEKNASADPQNPNLFGAKFTPGEVVDINSIIAQLETQDTVKANLAGTVESVCKKKGCWMNLVPDTGDNEIFVKFKDYGFFMPLDCEGAKVVMNGIAFKEVTSVEELQHYAEDEGKSPEEIAKITEPVEEFKFLADGVIMQ